MSEENKSTNNEQQEQKTQSTGGIKGFFKKVRDSLEKFDKKMQETMDNDDSCPPLYPEEEAKSNLDPEKELKEEDYEEPENK